MKTNTPYIFILSLLLLVGAGALILHVREGIASKIEVVRVYYAKEAENKNLGLGTTLKNEMNTLAQQEGIIKKTFLEKDIIVDFITYLETSAEFHDLVLAVEKVGYGTPEVLEEKYTITPITFNLELKGSFAQIESFVSNLMQLEKKLVIREMKLYKSEEGKSGYTARVTVEGVTISYE